MNPAPQPAPSPAPAVVDGRSARWTRHREQRRAELLEVARRLIHTQGPDVTMEDIAAASGTSKSIVYRYFADKAQLQRAIGMHILSGMHRRLVQEVRAVEESAGRDLLAAERIRAMTSAYVSAAQASPNVYRFVTRPSDGLNHFLTSVARLVATALPEGVPPGRAEVWSAGAVGFVQGSVDRWMRAGDPTEDSPEDNPGDTAEDSPDGLTADLPEAPTEGLPDAAELTEDIVGWLLHGILTTVGAAAPAAATSPTAMTTDPSEGDAPDGTDLPKGPAA